MKSMMDTTAHRTFKRTLTVLFWFILCCLIFFPLDGSTDDTISIPLNTETADKDYNLKLAVMCERIRGSTPVNRTVVFSASLGRAFCYNVFDPVFRETHIFHIWYHRDEVVSRKKLILKPQRWETYTMYKIGKKVKGPWRVELIDAQNRLIDILRFSVTD